jgi:hypothetical protein
VHAGEQVVVCVAEANLDVRSWISDLSPDTVDVCVIFTQEAAFGSDPRTPIFNRTPSDAAGILGIGRFG